MRLPRRVDEALERGLARIRTELGVPGGFPPEVSAAAENAVRRDVGRGHIDRTDRPFVTLDPATATDLDQAFSIERAGSDIVLHYAIADVGSFVMPGDALDQEAWRRGVTVYLPGEKAPLYPPVLSEAAASLLPDRPRPAVVFTVRISDDGAARLDGVERAVVHSRVKLAYDSVRAEDLPADFAELARRVEAAEARRGAPRVEFPDQELVRRDGGWELRFALRLRSEDENAGMSLATNLAVAAELVGAGTGLFRTMAPADEGDVRRLRFTAEAFGPAWPKSQSLAAFQRSLPSDDPRAAAFLIAVRRAGGRAGYEPFVAGVTPWHAAVAATYAHVTAPLRRLADRYVIEAAVAVASGRPVPEPVEEAFPALPAAMARGEELANRVDKAVISLAEAVLLAGREHDVFDAVVVDEDRHGPVIQLVDPAVLAHVEANRVDPGDDIRVRLTSVNLDARQIAFTRVS